MSRSRSDRGRLPVGWRIGLPLSVIETVLLVERYSARGLFILSKPDHKGYLWVRLCVRHPYANKAGWQRLHRYLLMRISGRRLASYEHGHHLPNALKTTTDVRQLSIMEADEHARFHSKRGWSRRLTTWSPRDKGRFTKFPVNGGGYEASEPDADSQVPF